MDEREWNLKKRKKKAEIDIQCMFRQCNLYVQETEVSH